MFLDIPKQAWLIFGIMGGFLAAMVLWMAWQGLKGERDFKRFSEEGWNGEPLYPNHPVPLF